MTELFVTDSRKTLLVEMVKIKHPSDDDLREVMTVLYKDKEYELTYDLFRQDYYGEVAGSYGSVVA